MEGRSDLEEGSVMGKGRVLPYVNRYGWIWYERKKRVDGKSFASFFPPISIMSAPPLQLPNELNLSPHLSAHKYFLVCTLTVAAWDTLVLSPRSWQLWKVPGWPVLKILYHFLRIFMPAEFVVVGQSF